MYQEKTCGRMIVRMLRKAVRMSEDGIDSGLKSVTKLVWIILR